MIEPDGAASSALSPAALTALFPGGVAAAQLECAGRREWLLPGETQCMGAGVSAKRIGEFAAGRLCARRALAGFGIVGRPLGVNPDRTPAWPEAMTGSITHTDGLCVAVVAERRRYAALGIDAEVVEHVTPDVWSYLCTAEEISWVQAASPGQRSARAALLFCAKEAFYKCQYALTGEWLDFHDVGVTVSGGHPPNGGFTVRVLRPAGTVRAAEFHGRYRFHRNWVLAGVSLDARERPKPQLAAGLHPSRLEAP